MKRTKKPAPNSEQKLIDELIPQLHRAAGTEFTRRTLRMVLDPLYRHYGRSDRNYGGWVSTQTAPNRPLKLIRQGASREEDILRIRDAWLKRHNLDCSPMIDEEHAEMNAMVLDATGGAENFDQYIERKMNDPRE